MALFDMCFGIVWFVGSALMGILYDKSVVALVTFSMAAQLVALPMLVSLGRQLHRNALSGRNRAPLNGQT